MRYILPSLVFAGVLILLRDFIRVILRDLNIIKTKHDVMPEVYSAPLPVTEVYTEDVADEDSDEDSEPDCDSCTTCPCRECALGLDACATCACKKCTESCTVDVPSYKGCIGCKKSSSCYSCNGVTLSGDSCNCKGCRCAKCTQLNCKCRCCSKELTCLQRVCLMGHR